MASIFAEFVLEEAALAWVDGFGYPIEHGPDIGASEFVAERTDYEQVVLEDCLRRALVQLSLQLPTD